MFSIGTSKSESLLVLDWFLQIVCLLLEVGMQDDQFHSFKPSHS